VIDPTADGAARALVKATGGGVAAAIDFVGAGASFSFGYGALRKGGTMVSVGLMGGSATVVPAMLSMKALTVIGSYTGSLQEMTELMALAGTGVLPDLPLTTQPLDNVTQALDDLRSGKIRGRTILKP
jgi:alcohol dehydrogenase/propanol-preferring alcohol dehydrogenase